MITADTTHPSNPRPSGPPPPPVPLPPNGPVRLAAGPDGGDGPWAPKPGPPTPKGRYPVHAYAGAAFTSIAGALSAQPHPQRFAPALAPAVTRG